MFCEYHMKHAWFAPMDVNSETTCAAMIDVTVSIDSQHSVGAVVCTQALTGLYLRFISVHLTSSILISNPHITARHGEMSHGCCSFHSFLNSSESQDW